MDLPKMIGTDEFAAKLRKIKYEALMDGFEIHGDITIMDVRDGIKVTVRL